MDDPNLAPPPEVSPDPIEIRDEDAITIDAALAIAVEASFPIGKSTLQRWAKYWRERSGAPVRSLLFTTRGGAVYKLSREDFEAWLFEQKQNLGARETSRDPIRSHETSRDPMRPRETSQSAFNETGSHEIGSRLKELENENMQLKIDLGVRKQLMERVKEEIDELRSTTNSLFRENGALQYQILQLAPPKPPAAEASTISHAVEFPPQQPSITP